MGTQKRRRLHKTTRQAARIKKKNSKNIQRRELKVPVSVWDRNLTLRQNYANMGLLHDFDAKLNETEDGIVNVKGVRGLRGEIKKEDYETTGRGYFARKKKEIEKKKLKSYGYVQELEKRAKNPKLKKKRFNISMEEIQCIERIIKKYGKIFLYNI